jgi:small subunit ribosomal protein S7
MRNSKAPKREILPDPKFHSQTVTKFVNKMMRGGKKSLAFNIFYDACAEVEKKTGESPIDVFNNALNNTMPAVEVRSRRVGGATFQIPTEVRAERKMALGMKWLLDFSRKRGERTMALRLANEMIAAAKGEGAAVKRKEEVHRMAEANKAFSHFRV